MTLVWLYIAFSNIRSSILVCFMLFFRAYIGTSRIIEFRLPLWLPLGRRSYHWFNTQTIPVTNQIVMIPVMYWNQYTFAPPHQIYVCHLVALMSYPFHPCSSLFISMTWSTWLNAWQLQLLWFITILITMLCIVCVLK